MCTIPLCFQNAKSIIPNEAIILLRLHCYNKLTPILKATVGIYQFLQNDCGVVYMQQIRLTKTNELEKVLSYLRNKYRLLSEAEIIKVALSEKYYKEMAESLDKDQHIRRAWEELKIEGKKLGDKLLAKKGLKREDMSEEDLYRLLENV